MKQYRKLALWMVCIICLTSVMAVNAQPAVIDESETGSINIRKYAVDDLNEHDVPATGEEQDLGNLTTISKVSFTVTRVQDTDTDPATATAIVGTGEYSHTLPTDEQGYARFTGLTLGVYLVHEESSAAVQAPVEDFLVSVPMTNPAGTGWIYDVYVYPKNELVGSPEMNLYVTEETNLYTSVDLGTEITWILTTEIPADIATASNYEIELAPDQYLVYTSGRETIYYRDAENVVQELEVTDDYEVAVQGNKAVITFKSAGKAKLFKAYEGRPEGERPLLYTEFKTTFQATAEEIQPILATAISVDALLRYTNELEVDFTSDLTESASIYTGGINLLKTDPAEDITLAGAKFKIYRNLDDANKGENAVLTPGGTEDWVIETNGSGKASFFGLAYGTNGQTPDAGSMTYYLVETQAPEGYNLLAAPKEVTVNNVSHLDNNVYTIENNTGFTLPATGGIGTILFTVIGLAILILAVFVYRAANKRRHED